MSRILVVDDDRAVLNATEEILEAYGYGVVATPSPEEALHLLKKDPHQFDAILLDWKLRSPLDGDIVLKLVRRIFPDFNTPIIFITAHTKISSKYLMRLGAYDTLAKPLSAEGLIDAIERAIKKKAEEDPHEKAPAYLNSQELRRQEILKKIVDALSSARTLTEAAVRLRCSRMTLYRWLKLTGLHPFIVEKEPQAL